MLAFLARSGNQATEHGFAALGLAADTTWLGKDDIQPVEMFRYESELNRFFLGHDIDGLCRYAIDAFPFALLVAGVETHPVIVSNTAVCDIFCFTPPE